MLLCLGRDGADGQSGLPGLPGFKGDRGEPGTAVGGVAGKAYDVAALLQVDLTAVLFFVRLCSDNDNTNHNLRDSTYKK